MPCHPLKDLAREDTDVVIAAIVRGERRLLRLHVGGIIEEGDTLVLRADSETLRGLFEESGLEPTRQERVADLVGSDDVSMIEVVVTPRSRLVGQSPISANLHRQHGVNVLAAAREGARLSTRVGMIRLRPGDVLLAQLDSASARETLASLRLLPLAERGFRLRQPPRVLIAIAIFGSALAIGTGLRVLPIEMVLAAGAGAMVLAGILTMDEAYEAIDWPVIVLLSAMIPVGGALETTGLAELIAQAVVELPSGLPPWGPVAILLIATMFLSDLVNNAAAAIVMAPIAVNVARGLDASADPLLMAVALGASCAFLTPIGHQSNVLVMGPGGYHFGDYWRLGLPLEIVIVAVGVPLIMVVWGA